jgi:hypothetical protein
MRISRGLHLTTNLQLVSRLRMSGDVPLLLLHDFMVWTGKTFPFSLRTVEVLLHSHLRAGIFSSRPDEVMGKMKCVPFPGISIRISDY